MDHTVVQKKHIPIVALFDQASQTGIAVQHLFGMALCACPEDAYHPAELCYSKSNSCASNGIPGLPCTLHLGTIADAQGSEVICPPCMQVTQTILKSNFTAISDEAFL